MLNFFVDARYRFIYVPIRRFCGFNHQVLNMIFKSTLNIAWSAHGMFNLALGIFTIYLVPRNMAAMARMEVGQRAPYCFI